MLTIVASLLAVITFWFGDGGWRHAIVWLLSTILLASVGVFSFSSVSSDTIIAVCALYMLVNATLHTRLQLNPTKEALRKVEVEKDCLRAAIVKHGGNIWTDDAGLPDVRWPT